MKKTLFVLLSFLFIGSLAQAQVDGTNHKIDKKKIRKARKKKNKEFKKGAASPLSKKDQRKFKKLAYYAIDKAYKVKANLKLTPNTEWFKMATSTGQPADYRQYAILSFTLKGKSYELPVYQNLRLMKMPQYKNYLFVPFTDLTNNKTTYGAGRYMEFYIPKDKNAAIFIDFNTAYNPYCAYSPNYSCPIPPKVNHLDIAIEAGEKKFKE